MTKDYNIREVMVSDAENLIEYLKVIGGESDNLTFGKEGLPISVKEEEKFIESLLKKKHSMMYLAIKDEEIIGQTSLSAYSGRMGHYSELGITVKKAYWNNGVGKSLLSKIIEYAKKNDIEFIDLRVRSDNARAIHLYKKFGFKKKGTYPAFLKIADKYYDIDLMVLDLR